MEITTDKEKIQSFWGNKQCGLMKGTSKHYLLSTAETLSTLKADKEISSKINFIHIYWSKQVSTSTFYFYKLHKYIVHS